MKHKLRITAWQLALVALLLRSPTRAAAGEGRAGEEGSALMGLILGP